MQDFLKEILHVPFAGSSRSQVSSVASRVFLLVFTLCGCSQSPEPKLQAKLPRESVLAVVEKIRSDRDYFLVLEPQRAIKKALMASQMDATAFADGCIELLQQGTPKEKQTVAEFLGQLGDPKAIPPLVAELDHPDDKVRRSACYALSWLHAKGETIESKLVKLCREDPSPGVRVWAAFALQGSHEQDAIAAYNCGLESMDKSLWQVSEDELERKGKLELPLPEHIYDEVSPETYKSMKSSGKRGIGREIKKNGTTYFEHYDGGNDGIPLRREWYRVRLTE